MSPANASPSSGSLVDVIRESCRRFPGRTAIRSGVETLSYDGLWRAIESRAGKLDSCDRWILLDGTDPCRFILDFLAAKLVKKGAIAHGPRVPPLLRELRERRIEEWSSPSSFPGTIFFSSGSVGDGKPIPLFDRQILASIDGYPQSSEIERSDHVAVAASVAHVFGLIRGTLHPLSIGAEVVFFAARRDPVAQAEALGATIAVLPSPLVALAASSRRPAQLRALFSGGAELSERDVSAIEAQRGIPVRLGYGLTESAGLGSRQRLAELRRPGTSGRPADRIRMEVVSETGCSVSAGVSGEIRISGPSVFDGYASDDTESPFDKQGRLMTGDLGYFDDAGELIIRGRRETSLCVGGQTFCAEELESAVREFHGIAEVAATPVEDSFALVLVPLGNWPSLEPELRQFLRQRHPVFGRSLRIIPVPALPRKPSGKVDRRALQMRFS